MSTVLEVTVVPYGPRDAGIPLTADEFEAAEFVEGFRYEVTSRRTTTTSSSYGISRD